MRQILLLPHCTDEETKELKEVTCSMSQSVEWLNQHSNTASPTSLPLSPPHHPLASSNLFSISVNLSFQEECYVNRIMQYVNFGDWSFLFSIILWRVIQVIAYISNSFLLLLTSIPQYGYTIV